MKVVIAGGNGHLGRILARSFDDVVVLSRASNWDGRTLGPWARELDGAGVVINLAGRSVNCRYTPKNLAEMMNSRVDSTRVIGQAIAAAKNPPRVWLQMSTATIYSHRFDAPNDEHSGVLGGDEPGAPAYWKYSIDIARNWEATLAGADTPSTRKVALRSAMVMSAERDGVFDVLLGLTRRHLGGAIAGGRQFVSWIHEDDFVRAIDFLIAHDLSGAVNLAAPNPLPQRDFMRALAGKSVQFPATKWMVELGAFFLRTDTELILKSRRVIPTRLLEAGFQFQYPEWPAAAIDLSDRARTSARPSSCRAPAPLR
jgi:uncharacterized protein (TIGR01777 family)